MEIKIGEHVVFGKFSIGVFRGLNEQGLAKVEIGLDSLSNPVCPLIAIVPLDELTVEEN